MSRDISGFANELRRFLQENSIDPDAVAVTLTFSDTKAYSAWLFTIERLWDRLMNSPWSNRPAMGEPFTLMGIRFQTAFAPPFPKAEILKRLDNIEEGARGLLAELKKIIVAK